MGGTTLFRRCFRHTSRGVLVFGLVVSIGCTQAITPQPQSPPPQPQSQAADPLPSWNEGRSKKALVEFVQAVTTAGAPDFVAVPERSTFDRFSRVADGAFAGRTVQPNAWE